MANSLRTRTIAVFGLLLATAVVLVVAVSRHSTKPVTAANVRGINALWNNGMWDYGYTSLKQP
jgi:hypothetical protein